MLIFAGKVTNMELRVRLRYKSTFDFGKGDCLLFDKSLAHALEWLYDEENFKEEGSLFYCMEGVLPIYIMMSIVTDIYTFALQEFAETNIRDYFLRMEEGVRWYDNKPSLMYLGEEIILGKVHMHTSEVILWATYLYVCYRADIDEENEKLKRAKKVLYKLFCKKTGRKEKLVKDTFLMKHFNQTIRDLAMDVYSRIKDDKHVVDNKPKPSPEELSTETSCQTAQPNDKSAHDQDADNEEWDDSIDSVFNKKVKPQEIKKALETLTSATLSEDKRRFVYYKVLVYIRYIPTEKRGSKKNFLKWWNLHFNCNWVETHTLDPFKFRVDSRLMNSQPYEWNEIDMDNANDYYDFAKTVKNTFTQTVINNVAQDGQDFNAGPLLDRGQFLKDTHKPINNGKTFFKS